MKSQITLANKRTLQKTNINFIGKEDGFLTMEILLAFSIFTLFAISTFTLESSISHLRIWSLKELDSIANADYADSSLSDYRESWGRNNCDIYLRFDNNSQSPVYFPEGIDIGGGNVSTDIEARNGIVYLTADATISAYADLFIINTIDTAHPTLVSSLNTGPGVSAIEIAGPYIFLAQSSSVNQLQIIDIHNRSSPQLISQLKLPLPTPTTTAPFATSIFYSKGFIYLGTVKWNGAEFTIIDVSNIYNPTVLGTFETNTKINDIYVNENTAFLASSDTQQIRILDVTDKSNLVLINSFSPSGSQTAEGKVLDYWQGGFGFGRSTGGFNIMANHEVFVFATSSDFSDIPSYISKDIAGGIYGMTMRNDNVFLLTHSTDHEFQIWDSTLSARISDISLGIQGKRMSCDLSNFYFATGDSRGFMLLKL